MKVYAVIVCIDGETRISGIYGKHEDAEAVASDIAEYAGLVYDDTFTDIWAGDDFGAPESEYVMIETHDVL